MSTARKCPEPSDKSSTSANVTKPAAAPLVPPDHLARTDKTVRQDRPASPVSPERTAPTHQLPPPETRDAECAPTALEDPLDPPVPLAPLAHEVEMEPTAAMPCPAQMDPQDPPDLPVNLDSPATPDPKVHPDSPAPADRRANPDPRDLLDPPAHPDLLDRTATPETPVLRDPLAPLETPAAPVAPEMLAPPAHLVPPDPPERMPSTVLAHDDLLPRSPSRPRPRPPKLGLVWHIADVSCELQHQLFVSMLYPIVSIISLLFTLDTRCSPKF